MPIIMLPWLVMLQERVKKPLMNIRLSKIFPVKSQGVCSPEFSKSALALFVIAIAGLAAYAHTFNFPFVFDDLNADTGIALNPVIKDLSNFTESLKGYEYNPGRFIGYLTFALNYHFNGLDVTGYHVVNLLIHLTNAILVYFLVVLTFRTPYFRVSETRDQGPGNQPLPVPSPQSPVPVYIALFSALFFVSHPVQTQAVTYTVQRFTSLVTLFYLLSMVMYIRGRLTSQPAGWLAGLFLSLFFAVLAMKTKEIAFTLPIMILLYEFIFFKSTLKRKFMFLLPVLVTLAIIPLSIMQIDKPLGEVLSDLSERSRLQTDMARGDYLITQMRVIVTYIRLIVLPINQNLDYDFPTYHSLTELPVLLSTVFLSVLLGTAVYLLYKSRHADKPTSWQAPERKGEDISHTLPSFLHYLRLIAFGILWFFLALSVESSFIPIEDVIFEHRIYLPSVGAFIAIISAIALLPHFRRIDSRGLAAGLSIIVVLCIGMTYQRNLTWKDPVTLWSDTVNKSPYKARPLYNLGIAYESRGENENAAAYYTYAVLARPDYYEASARLGYVYFKMNQFARAEREYQRTLSLNPDYAYVYNYMGELYAHRGDYTKAIEYLRYAIYLKDDAEFYNNLGTVFVGAGYVHDAIRTLKTAIAVNPDYSMPYLTLGRLHQSRRDYPEAIKVYKQALERTPENAAVRAGLCLAYYQAGDIGSAKKEFMILRNLDPRTAASLNSLRSELGLQDS